jgi:hypothetical protein
MQLTLRDLLSGVIAVSNQDGFPLESCPPQGKVTVQLGSDKFIEVMANMDEYEKAQKHCGFRRHCMQCAVAYTETRRPEPMQPYCPVCSST